MLAIVLFETFASFRDADARASQEAGAVSAEAAAEWRIGLLPHGADPPCDESGFPGPG